MHLTYAALSLVYTSRSHPIAAFPPWLSWVIIVGACYGALRLLYDAARALGWIKMTPGRARDS